ncbi:MAG: GNAT family N-acetyltransferase [Armatimonadetes bacterium]|nr:GNAT family N-acetyltransferase [Armatimonadota bacterium]
MKRYIRPFEARDYEALARLNQLAGPGLHETADELRYFDAHRYRGEDDRPSAPPRLVAAEGERLVGAAWDNTTMYHQAAGQGRFQIVVQPSWRGQGLGSALFDRLLPELEQAVLTTRAAEDDGDTMRFLRRRGFEVVDREQELELSLADFDPDVFAAEEHRPFAGRLRLATLAELRGRPAIERQLAALWLDETGDQPIAEEMLECFRATVLEGPRVVPDGFFIALEGDQVAAVTNLERWASTTALEFGYTVVRPDHRQRGLALALKVRALRFARERGCPTVCTLNSLANERMLRINEHLGFQRTRVWAELQRAKEWMP